MVILLITTFIIATYTFGLAFGTDIFKIAFFGADQLLITFGLALSFGSDRVNRLKLTPLLSPIVIFLFLIGFQMLRSYLEGMSIVSIFKELMRIYVLLYVFPLIVLIKNRFELKKFMNYILLVGFVDSLASVYQFFTGAAFNASFSAAFLGRFRVYHPGGVLMSICLFFVLANFLTRGFEKGNIWKYLLVPFYIVGLLTTLHRSLIGITIISLLFIYLIHIWNSRRGRIGRVLILSLLIFFVGYYFINLSDIGLDVVASRANSAISDIQYRTGTYNTRLVIIARAFSAIFEQSPIIGRGFLYNFGGPVLFDPFAITYDADYGNLVIFFGFSGLLVLAYLYYKMTLISYKSYKKTTNIEDKVLYLAIVPVPLFFALLGMFSSIFFYSPNLTVFITIVGILYVLKYFNENDNCKEITDLNY